MPPDLSHSKSCDTCRISKTRCTLDLPCTRCVEQQIQCVYTLESTVLTRPQSSYLRRLEPARVTQPESPSYTDLSPNHRSLPAPAPPTDQSPVFRQGLFEAQVTPGNGARNALIEPTRPAAILSVRERRDAQDSMTTNMLMGQLTTYPKMLAEGLTIPPFIFPPCALSLSGRCPADAQHVCLPEILAICTSLVQIYVSRTPGSADFVWRQIEAEVRRLGSRRGDLSDDAKLHSLQALIVYTILQSMDQRALDDSSLIISMCETFSKDLFTRVPVSSEAEALCATRGEWAFLESLRRIGLLLYIIDLTVVTGGKTAWNGESPAALCVPLPCSRELWDPVDGPSWQRRFQAHQRKLRGNQLTLGSLLALRNTTSMSGNTEQRARQESEAYLGEWSREADDFGMLLWMATSLQRHEQTLFRNILNPR